MENKENDGGKENKQYLYENYLDLLAGDTEGTNPDFIRLIGMLDALAEEYDPMPATVNSIAVVLRKQSYGRVSQSKGKEKLSLFGLPLRMYINTRLGFMSRAILLLLVAVTLMGATYSVLSVIDQAFFLDPTTARISEQKLGKEINQSQAVNGFTVSVKRVYADRSVVIVGYTIKGPTGRKFNSLLGWGDLNEASGQQVPTLPILTDLDGNSLDFFGRGSDRDISGVYGTGVQDGEAGQVLKYKTPALPTGAKDIKLRFRVGKLTAYEQLSGGKFADITVDGPFTFEFTVPVTGS